MEIIDFAIQNLTIEEKKYIKNLNLENLSYEHFGISMVIRNILRKYEKELILDAETLGIKFPTIDFFWKGEMSENFLLEKLWRIFNNIEFSENDKSRLRKIIGDSDTIILDPHIRDEMIEYIEKLKK